MCQIHIEDTSVWYDRLACLLWSIIKVEFDSAFMWNFCNGNNIIFKSTSKGLGVESIAMCAYCYDETSANWLLAADIPFVMCVWMLRRWWVKESGSQYSYAIVLGIKMTAGRHEDGHQSDSPLQPNHPVARFFGGVRIGGRLWFENWTIPVTSVLESIRASPKIKAHSFIHESAADVMSRPNHQSCRDNRAMNLYRGAINGDVARARW